MSRVVSICLCAMVAFVAVAGINLVDPMSALAASGTLTMETPLHHDPDHGSPLVALLPEGTIVSIDGPPINGFYPVSTETLFGWMRGETLALSKDVIDESATPVATDAATDGYLSAEQQATTTPPATGEPPLADPALTSPPPAGPSATGGAPADPSLAAAPAPDAASDPPADSWVSTDPATSPAAAEPLAGSASGQPTAEAATADPAAGAPNAASLPSEPVVTDPAAGEAMTTTPVPDVLAAATPAAAPAGNEGAPEISVTPEPTPDPNVTPLPVVEPAPTGPAGVVVDMPIVSGPGPDYGLIFTVPAGSTVEQTGQLVDGYVSVRYKEVSGWAAREHLAEPSDLAAEPPPEETAEPIETKTPKPGSGVAFNTIDLSLRDGPSANAEPITMVPAGSRLILTGVMEGNFQRVTYGDLVGWVSNDYLTTPESPAPNEEARGKQEKYSRREIVRYIYQAADRYGQSREDMLRVAECESNLDPYAVNPSGSYGLFQFIRSTWKSTPYGDEDIFDPQANANAAGWMWAQGRKSEWVCQ